MFFQIDDQLTNSRKHRELAEMAMLGNLVGPAAIGLWTMSGAQCQASLTDGVVSRQDAVRVFLNPQLVDECAAELVRVGLWHEPGHTCPRCPAVADGTWLFHDWFDLGYDRADQVTVTRRKRRELKDQKIINAVWARDCADPANPNEANCRYCGVLVRRKDTRSKGGRRPHLDHVDPNRADGARNIVIACEDCNRTKGNRTPAQAGLTLLPPPREDVSPQPAEQVSPPTGAADNRRPGSVAGTAEVSPPARVAEIRPADSPPTGAAEFADQDSPPKRAAEFGPVSPPMGAAETTTWPRPAAAGPLTGKGSPGTPAAEPASWPVDRSPRTDHAATTPRPRDHASGPQDQRPAQTPPAPDPTTHRPRADHAKRGVPARDARAHVGLVGSGQGLGSGRGPGKGSAGPPAVDQPTDQPQARRRSRRRRRRGRGPRPAQSPPASPAQPTTAPEPLAPLWDAGPAPDVPTPGRFGSPWHGWTGPPSTVTDTDCDEHGLPMPCRRCADQTGDSL